MSEMNNVYATLSKVNVNEHTETKNGLTYLSWAWAWAKLLELFPNSTYKVYERDGQFGPVNYFTDGKTCYVKTGVTVEGKEYIEYLPVMDFKNRSIPVENVTSFDVNKSIQRSLTKAVARHGLGLYIYAGEDLPDDGSGSSAAPQRDLAATVLELDKEVRRVTANMDTEAKRAFAAKYLVPVFGTVNYKTCKDVSKVAAMVDTLKKLPA